MPQRPRRPSTLCQLEGVELASARRLDIHHTIQPAASEVRVAVVQLDDEIALGGGGVTAGLHPAAFRIVGVAEQLGWEDLLPPRAVEALRKQWSGSSAALKQSRRQRPGRAGEQHREGGKDLEIGPDMQSDLGPIQHDRPVYLVALCSSPCRTLPPSLVLLREEVPLWV